MYGKFLLLCNNFVLTVILKPGYESCSDSLNNSAFFEFFSCHILPLVGNFWPTHILYCLIDNYVLVMYRQGKGTAGVEETELSV